MPLSPGTKLGPYEIVAPIGAGGMGEVYRAKDTKLGRDVAVKILPAALAQDPDRLARFEREAKVLASLNHPHIAQIYGLEERALVMELVPGETLKGPLPLDTALNYARQIAEALEAAHEKGIVHRDLKPGNIMVTPDGVVKVLDFGLAAVAQEPASGSADPNNSPTLTARATQVGVIMGTAAYMSPEQAAGKPVDKRSDVWSFGVVLFEMLTGKRLFDGETISHTLADVLRAPIDFEKLPKQTPLAARELLKRCLDRDMKTRLRDIGEARIAMQRYLADPQSRTEVLAQATRSTAQHRVPWAVAAVSVLIAGGAGLGWWRSTRPVDRPMMRLRVDLGPEAERDARVSTLLSPDGRRLVFTGRASGGQNQLYTRRLDQPEATLLAGTENRDLEPFFSPDGEWIGFWAFDSKIKKVAAQGGSPMTLSEPISSVLGASWGDDNNIIFGTLGGLFRVPAAGGTPVKLLKEGHGPQIFPQVLPGSKAVLFNGFSGGSLAVAGSLENFNIEALQLDTGQKKTLVQGGYWPRYLATSGKTGHLIYMHGGTLFGVAFDPLRLELLGTPTRLLDDVAAGETLSEGGGQFSVSGAGTLVYLSVRDQSPFYPVSWLDAAGKVTPVVAQPASYGAPRLSPDGKRLAYLAPSSKGRDVWVYDLERSVSTQVTFLGSADSEVAWARDSKHLVYGDGTALWWTRADGGGQRQPLLDKAIDPRPTSITPAQGDKAQLTFSPALAPSMPEIWTLPLDLSDSEHPKPGKAEPFLAEAGVVVVDPAFSPDGKFIAYASNESSADEEVFVRSFPGPGGKWKVSTNGGKFPAWSPVTHQLLFLGIDDHIMAATYSTQGDAFQAATPRIWSPTLVHRTGVQQNFDVSPDGKRVIMFPRPAAEGASGSLHATFLLNFFDEVRRRVPAGK